MSTYKAPRKLIKSSMVVTQKRHTEFRFYAREPEFFEWADWLHFPLVAPLEDGTYMVFSGLDRYYVQRLDASDYFLAHVLEEFPDFEITYLKAEPEHPLKRLRNVLDALNMVRLMQHPVLLADTDRYHEAMAVITDRPLDLIKKLDALLVHSSYEIWSEFYEGTINLEDALYQTFEAQ